MSVSAIGQNSVAKQASQQLQDKANELGNRVNHWIQLGSFFLAIGILAALVATNGLNHIIIHASKSACEMILGGAGVSLFFGGSLLAKGIYDRKYKPIDCNPKEFGLSGIKNTNNNCWLNSLLQMLLNAPVLKEGLHRNRNFRPFLDAYDTSLRGSENPDSQSIRRYLSGICSDIRTDHQFQDADEPLTAILQLLKGGISNLRNFLNATFHYRYADGRVQTSQKREEDNGLIKLAITPGVSYTIPALLAEFFHSKQNAEAHVTQPLKRTVQEPCFFDPWSRNKEVTEHVVVERRRLTLEQRKYAFSPNDLFISLKRFQVNPDVTVPFHLHMDKKYFETNQAAYYELKSFACHVSGVHYISYVKRNGIWFECDDNSVRPVAMATADNAAKRAYIVHYKKL